MAASEGTYEVVVEPRTMVCLSLSYEIPVEMYNRHRPPTLYLVLDDPDDIERRFELEKRAGGTSMYVLRGEYEFLFGVTRETAKRIGRYEVNGDQIDWN
jgi:hypothetical protein